MDTNELINADLFPRNVPKPSSFHENTLKPEVPEVSLMFEGGFQFNRPNETNKQTQERATNRSCMKMTIDAARDRESSSPGLSDPADNNMSKILLLKNSKQHLIPNKQTFKTTNKSSKSDKNDSFKSSSDEMDIERQNGEKHNRHINSDNHLIEPVESYSVWKYKNQHMFAKESGQGSWKENDNNGSPEYRNKDRENREQSSNKPPYRPNYDQQQVDMRNNQKPSFEHNPPYHRMEYLKYSQEHHSPNSEYVNKNDVYRIEENCVPNRKSTGKSNWSTAPPLMADTLEPVARYNDALPYQRKTSDQNNGVTELYKIVEFQTKHIEFLNEQIYTLTLQNKTLSNLTKHVKTMENTQLEQFEFLKKNFENLQQTILNANKENNLTHAISSPNIMVPALEKDTVADHLDRMEKKLIVLINSKLNNKTHNEPNDTDCVKPNQIHLDDENETSSSEDLALVNYKHNTSKQCNCACDTPKQQSTKCRQKEISNKVNHKCPAPKTEHRGNVKHFDKQTDVLKHSGKIAKEWECPPGHSKQMSSKNSSKKIQRKPEQVEQVIMNPAMTKSLAQPLLYYQQPLYQADKFNANHQRGSHGEKQVKDKSRNSPPKKHNVSRMKKTMKPKPSHYSKNNGRVNYRVDNTLLNEDHSLTLNARELPVINEHIPSPEASVHIDMGEYQSSSSEFQDSDEENRDVSGDSNEEENDGAAPWPTFYNNVVGKVHKLLQSNQQASEEQLSDIPDDQYRTVQVRMATIDQFKKMGISFVDDSPNSKRVTFNKSKNKLNAQHENYAGEPVKRSPLTAMCNTNLSFASLQYLQRYHLIPTPNSHTQEPFLPGQNTIQRD